MQALRRPLLTTFSTLRTLLAQPTRPLHHAIYRQFPPPVPPATSRVPDVAAFLTAIGRQCGQHASKFESWDHFFSAPAHAFKDLGIEPARTRRYMLRWRETYRRNEGNVALFEQLRGHKVDGGERRRKMVRAKRLAEERKKAVGEEGAILG